MFELRLNNFIVFRDYKLYDLIVPKLQRNTRAYVDIFKYEN